MTAYSYFFGAVFMGLGTLYYAISGHKSVFVDDDHSGAHSVFVIPQEVSFISPFSSYVVT